MSMPIPWQAWLGLLVAVNAAGPIYFFYALEAKIVLGAFLASVALMTAIFASKGFVRLLGLGHIFWVPMVPWLFARLDQVGPGNFLGYWMITVMAVNSLSLIIDAIDVFRYVRGERDPYIADHRTSDAHQGGGHHHSPLATSAHATLLDISPG